MGKYAFYVWTSYGLAAVILVINLVIPLWQRQRILRLLARRSRK